MGQTHPLSPSKHPRHSTQRGRTIEPPNLRARVLICPKTLFFLSSAHTPAPPRLGKGQARLEQKRSKRGDDEAKKHDKTIGPTAYNHNTIVVPKSTLESPREKPAGEETHPPR